MPLDKDLLIDEVDHAYEGDRETCTCGCAGVHYTSNPEKTSCEFEPEEVARIVESINYNKDIAFDGGDYVSVETGPDLLIAYRKKKE